MDHQSSTTAKGGGRSPPYYAYSNFSALMRDLKNNGIPPRIDRDAMVGVPETVRSQVMTGLRFLSLIDQDDRPTQSLRALVEAYETAEWSDRLQEVLRSAYKEIMQLDLLNITPAHLLDAFAPYAASDEVRRKCFVFFLAAAKEAQVPLGARLNKASRSGAAPATRRKSKNGKRDAQSTSTGTTAPVPPSPTTTPAAASLVGQLVSKFPEFDPKWPDDIKAKWFDGFQQFMGLTKNQT